MELKNKKEYTKPELKVHEGYEQDVLNSPGCQSFPDEWDPGCSVIGPG